MKKSIIHIIFLLLVNAVFAQNIDKSILEKRWKAAWITAPNAQPNGYGVYLFRKIVELNSVPRTYIIHVSADNRYKLYVNEKLVSLGPARGDLGHWNFETVDLAKYLTSGKNIIAAQVWNEAQWRPEAQISAMTGFILNGNTLAEKDINTNTSWKCMQDSSYAPIKVSVSGYYVAGAGEERKFSISPKNWQSLNFNDKDWKSAKFLTTGLPKNNTETYGETSNWMLVPSMIPQMELKNERLQNLVSTEGSFKISDDFISKKTDLKIPANSTITMLLDQGYLTNAYPNLVFSGGKNSTISIKYAEALFNKNRGKGNRNETEGKTFTGREDKIYADGTANQAFTTLNYRTFRFIQITITTKDEDLVLHDIYGTFTGYPFELKSNLVTSRTDIPKMIEIGWRTARLCATETYMDCPYYEQLQYIGDGRIQAMVSLYNTGDERLVKNALNLMDNSRLPEGLTESRHPSYSPQFIPTFSLWYIGMLQDYARYGSDMEFAKNKIAGTRQILNFFSNYQTIDGSLKNVPYWMFSDWVDNAKDWKAGVAPRGADGTSASIDLQLLMAYQSAIFLESQLGMKALIPFYESKISQLKKTIREKYWDSSKKLFADRTEKDVFSQHANALAILTETATDAETQQISEQLLNNSSLAPASIYFKYYLHQALIKAGKGDDYVKWLDKWRENINMGLTTWAEMSDVDKSRSDCHAWGSSPNIEFYRTLLGIDSDGIGFSKIKIEPHLGELKELKGKMPHSKGEIMAEYVLENGFWNIKINLPKEITGIFIWKGKNIVLKSGENTLKIKS